MKRSFLLLLSLIILSFLYSQSPVVIYENDFDSYIPGDHLGIIDPGNWKTWSGGTGTSEDAMISDAFANTAPNSFKVDEVGGPTDIVWLLGDKTTGVYQVNWNMYIPSGFDAYYNFQKSEIPGTEWAVEVYYYSDGTAEVIVDQSVAATFNYNVAKWINMDHIIDLDDDVAELYYDGTLIHSWIWSNFGLLKLGGVDFYATQNAVYYVDDVCFSSLAVGVNEISTAEDFILYPNPANTHLNINANSAIKEIHVYNYVGQLVDNKLAGDSFYTLNTMTYKAGIYFVQVQTEKGILTKKVIIE